MLQAISADLYRAIFAMDTYNHGYRINVRLGSDPTDNPLNVGLGEAVIKYDSRVLTGPNGIPLAELAGFYAIAYDVTDVASFGNVDTVIAYRGTDLDGIVPTWEDVWYGWTVYLGFSANTQAALAKDFYGFVQEGANRTTATAYVQSDGTTELTGHSLGGGLAGFVGSISGAPSLLFDHMPFGVAAVGDVLTRAYQLNGQQSPDILSDVGLTFPQLGLPRSIYFENEILKTLRNGTIGLPNILDLLLESVPVFGDLLSQYLIPFTSSAAELDSLISNKTEMALPGIGAETGAFERHSISLLAIAMFGDDPSQVQGTNWHAAGRYVFPELTNSSIAESVGRALDTTGLSSPGDQLSTMIAYSILPSGTLPFGNTAIRALFDDTSDLGSLVSQRDVSPSAVSARLTEPNMKLLGEIIVNYAALLAVSKTTSTTASPFPLDGIMQYDIEGGALFVDLRPETWSFPQTAGYDAPIGRETLLDGLLAYDSTSIAQAERYAEWYGRVRPTGLGALGAGYNWIYDRIGSLTFDTNGVGGEVTSPYDQSGRLSVIFTRDAVGGMTVVGQSDTLIVGGNAGETITGGQGYDILLGGGGDDILVGGGGSDWFDGGQGADVIFGGALGAYGNASETDTVDYRDYADTLSLDINGLGSSFWMSIADDELYSIERLLLSDDIERIRLTGELSPNSGIAIETISPSIENVTLDLSLYAGPAGLAVYLQRTTYIFEDGTLSEIAASGSISGRSLSGFSFDIPGLNNSNIIGSQYDDIIFFVSSGNSPIVFGSSSGYNQIIAGHGNDHIRSHLDGYSSISTLMMGESGNDLIEGGDGVDTIIGGPGRDIMSGGGGPDFIRGEADDGYVSTSASPFNINGGGDHDAIIVGGGAQSSHLTIVGGSGNDYVELGNNVSATFLVGQGDGRDVIKLTGQETSVPIIQFNELASSHFLVRFSLNSVGLGFPANDNTEMLYLAKGDILIYSSVDAISVVIENVPISISVPTGFTDFENIQLSDLLSYRFNDIVFKTGALINSLPVAGVRQNGQWQTEGLPFSITGAEFEPEYTSALSDFMASRGDALPIPTDLWIV